MNANVNRSDCGEISQTRTESDEIKSTKCLTLNLSDQIGSKSVMLECVRNKREKINKQAFDTVCNEAAADRRNDTCAAVWLEFSNIKW